MRSSLADPILAFDLACPVLYLERLNYRSFVLRIELGEFLVAFCKRRVLPWLAH